MKKILIVVVLFCFVFPIFAATYEIVKGGNSNNLIVKFDKNRAFLTIGSKFQEVLVKDVNEDGSIEVVTSLFEGESVWYYFYQVIKDGMYKPLLEVEGTKDFNNSKSQLLFKDIDGNGKEELVVKTATHSNYGNMVGPGNVFWTDVYDLFPEFKNQNEKYPFVYKKLKSELLAEIEKFNASLRELGDETQDIVKRQNINQWLDVYNKWLKRIK